MAIIDAANKVVTLKIVYYGCAKGGKTTNLISLHRLTDPDGAHRLVSIATDDDRTLFFDLLPVNLGQVGGMTVQAKLYTVPGQVHYELTRRRVLAGADGVVLVVDSSAAVAKENLWAEQNLRQNLKTNGLDESVVPTIVQWNKRDLKDARPLDELQAELNPRKRSSVESVATSGAGVVETFAMVLSKALAAVYTKAGQKEISADAVRRTVDTALEQARGRAPELKQPGRSNFEHRFDLGTYREKEAKSGHNRSVVDQESLLSEAVQTNMMLAEKLDDMEDAQRMSVRRGLMMEALGKAAPTLADPSGELIPNNVMSQLLQGCRRKHGSILFFRPGTKVMDEREVVPRGKDPLNSTVVESLGSVAFRLCQESRFRVVDDLQNEVFFGDPPPQAADMGSALIAPIRCDGLAFGSLMIYSLIAEPAFDQAERDYWTTASTLVGLSIHWRLLRKKMGASGASLRA